MQRKQLFYFSVLKTHSGMLMIQMCLILWEQMFGKSFSPLLPPIFFFLIVPDDIGLQWSLYCSEANLSTSLPVP